MSNFLEKIIKTKFWWVFLLLVLVAVNFLASSFHTRFDLTKEKRYTLSNATKQLLRNLEDNVEIDVFLKGTFPSGFKKLANSTGDFLDLVKDLNSSKINYRFISPKEQMPGTTITYGDSLVSLGANPINLTAQVEEGQQRSYVFPVALLNYKGQQRLVNLYTGSDRFISQSDINDAEALLEYQFVSALDKLVNTKKPSIAYAVGNGEPVDSRVYDLTETLKQDYGFGMFNLQTQPFIPSEINALLIVKPSLQFSEDEKLKLDQYVMHGGKLICFIDNLNAESDSLVFKPELIAYDRNLNLTDLFFKYGARINTDLVMDLQCESIPFVVGKSNTGQPQQEFLRWNYYPLFQPFGDNSITKNLGLIGSRFVNSMDTINAPGVKKTVLLASSPSSRKIGTPALISLNENKNAPQDDKFKTANIPVAMLLEGKFTSLYRNRVTSAQMDSLTAYKTPFLPSSDDNKMIIVADGDMVLNEFIPSQGPGSPSVPLPMGWNRYTFLAYQQQAEDGKYFIEVFNRQFLQNCIEYLVANPAIIETRNKNIVLRLLDTPKVKEQKSMWQFINILLPILIVILIGIIYYQIRKRSYGA